VNKDLDTKIQQEFAEWARLTDKLAEEVKRSQMECDYCNCRLTEESVNSICSLNMG
jgi:hypothetical protein